MVLAVLMSFLFASQPSERPESEIKQLIDAWVSMWNSYDLALVEKLFLVDSRVSYFSSEKEGLIRGIDAVRKHHAGFGFVDGGKKQENKLWVEDIHVQVFGSATIVAGIWYFQKESNESAQIQKGPFTFVCVKELNEWRLAHLNFSEYK